MKSTGLGTRKSKLSRIGASLDNESNFWLSRSSIYNLLRHVGFTSVLDCHIPAEPDKPGDRITLSSNQGAALSAPQCSLNGHDGPLIYARSAPPEHSKAFYLLRDMSHVLPWRARRLGKKLLGVEGQAREHLN